MGFKMRPKSPLTKKLVGGQHRLPAELKQEILNSPAKMKENFGTGDKKTERKLNRINRKMQKQHAKQDRNEDKGTKRGDRRADKAHAKGRKLLAKGRAVKKASDERTAKENTMNLKEVGPPKESPAKKRGLWDNIHAKRKRGETMRKKGDKGAPTEKAIKESQSPAKMKDLSGDGKITKKDVLIGRGVLKKDSPSKMKKK